ncbi:MAG: hypothetical protein JWM86_849 [Thermoleophilia bacterium]|nr:hypothetical protein [Thermoleophilia bacterium]
MPPAGKVMLGVGGTWIGPRQFDALTGAQHELHLVTASWNETRPNGWYDVLIVPMVRARAEGFRLMVHVDAAMPGGAEGRSPRAVARGAADAYLLDLGRVVNESGQVIYVRPPGEMNGNWSRWSAFDADGTPRGPEHRTADYRGAFVRMAEIVRGGDVAAINRRLRGQGLPPLRTTDAALPSSGLVSLVWNPQAEGSPNVPGNQPDDYYPGARWVDYVANDIYAQRGRAAWAQHEAFYARYADRHPFMVAEYAPWGYDDPAFVQRMFEWTASHPRTVALIYFNGTAGTSFRLNTKPVTLAVYRAAAQEARYRCTNTSEACSS